MKEILIIDSIDIKKVSILDKNSIDIELPESRHLVLTNHALNYIRESIDKLIKRQINYDEDLLRE